MTRAWIFANDRRISQAIHPSWSQGTLLPDLAHHRMSAQPLFQIQVGSSF